MPEPVAETTPHCYHTWERIFVGAEVAAANGAVPSTETVLTFVDICHECSERKVVTTTRCEAPDERPAVEEQSPRRKVLNFLFG